MMPWLAYSQNPEKINKKNLLVSDLLHKPEIIELKSKIEQAITKNYRDRISTQLDSSLFSVSTQVSLIELPETEKKNSDVKEDKPVENKEIETVPADLNLGNIPIHPIYEKFKNELKTNENGKNALSDLFIESWMSRVQISRIEVFVGLDRDLDSSYRKELSQWIGKVIKSEFGSVGNHKAFEITRLKKVEPPKEIITVYDQLSKFQVTLGFVILSVIVFLAVLMSRFTTSKDIKVRNEMALRIEEMKVAQMNSLSVNSKNLIQEGVGKKSGKDIKGDEDLQLQGIQLQVIAQAFRDLQFKIGFLFESNNLPIGEIAESWFGQGWQGRIKFAALIDAILSYSSVIQMGDGHINSTRPSSKFIPKEMLELMKSGNAHLESELHEAFQEFPNIALQDRYKILEQSYWDLLSLQAMGKKALKSRFSILQDLNNDQIQEVLSKQDPKLKTLALLHLPKSKIQNLLLSMNNEEKQKIVNDSLRIKNLSLSDVELADETLKFAIEKNKSQMDTGVSVETLIPNLLSALSVSDEFKMLPHAVSQLSDQGLQIKKTYPSLVFLTEWPEEAFKLFFDQVEIKYIVSLLTIAPQLQSKVLKVLSPKMSTIVADEVKQGVNRDPEEIEKNLTFLKTRLYRLVNDEVISLNKIFKTKSTVNVVKGKSAA